MKAHPPYNAVLLDLDGTLTDSEPGIVRSIAYALEQLGAPVPPPTVLHDWIGPPLHDTFTSYLGTTTLADRALAAYRERYVPIGMYENDVYPGIPALLTDLHEAGVRLYLATSKPQPYARLILEHFDLLRFFTYAGGATLDGRISTKAAVIGDVLDQMSSADHAACVMVGDRSHDIEGARTHGLRCIAVRYGYASVAELQASQPDAMAASVAELRALLLPERTAPDA
ncbi:MAG: HAD family hydrolase [Chloroflexaceae bacterium]|nr:HAD family hydrolase [Chloroflexaceae bacterium]NJL32673.1 HAD family hydrolase [Chloroflexaceae bacterium]NJO05756.1 HAD family hydrolase [Chloroflexaceae bacterium]